MPDLSEYLDFGFYDWVWYKDNAGVGENSWGRWLGVSHRVGNLMSYWILTLAGRVVSRTTVQQITNLEQGTDKVKQQMREFDERIRVLLNQNHVIQGEGDRQLQDWNEYTEDPDQAFVDDFDRAVSDERIAEEDQEDFTPDTFDDSYINKEIALPRGVGDGEDVHYGRVTKRLRDADGKPIGMANENPMLDT